MNINQKGCVLCNMTNDGTNKEIFGYVICENCIRKMNLPSDKMIKSWKTQYDKGDLLLPKNHAEKGKDYIDFLKERKLSAISQLIYSSYLLERAKKLIQIKEK